MAGPSRPAIARAPVCRTGAFGLVVGISPNARPRRSNGRSWVLQVRRRDSESSVDDLGTWRGVVLGRAVTTLRSVETQPYAWGFVLSVRRDPAIIYILYHIAPLRYVAMQPRTRRPSMRTTVVRDVAHGAYEEERKEKFRCVTAIDAHDGRT